MAPGAMEEKLYLTLTACNTGCAVVAVAGGPPGWVVGMSGVDIVSPDGVPTPGTLVPIVPVPVVEALPMLSEVE